MDDDRLKDKIDFYKNKKIEIELCLKELNGLIENENVKRFLELLEYDTDENRDLVLMNEEELEEYARRKLIDEDKAYFCVGKGFNGFQKKDGSYMILAHSFDDYKLLSHYISLDDKSDEIIIPKDEADIFEKNHNIVYRQSLDPFDEYNDLSKKYKEKLLKKRY